jgi:hypothetical protein
VHSKFVGLTSGKYLSGLRTCCFPIVLSCDANWSVNTGDFTVILDNCTRWNSTYLSIHRGLKLKRAIQLFLLDFHQPLQKDLLTEDDWAQLKAIHEALEPFYRVTKRLEGGAETGSYGVI